MMAKSLSMSKNFKETYGFLRAQPYGLIDPSLLREPTDKAVPYILVNVKSGEFFLVKGQKFTAGAVNFRRR